MRRVISAGKLQKAASFTKEGRTPKTRTPSFNTRRPHSLKKVAPFVSLQGGPGGDWARLLEVRGWEELESVAMAGMLERKSELISGGKRAPVRSWKPHYAILCGQLLAFFKDEEAYMEAAASAPPIPIQGARVSHQPDYVKRKFAFRLHCSDGAEFLFAPPSAKDADEWVAKIAYHAALPPSLQLKGPPFSSRPPSSSTTPGCRLRRRRRPAQLPSPARVRPRHTRQSHSP